MSIIYFIQKNYEMVEERSFGYASGYLVTNGNKKGYLNKQGKVLIPAIYDAIEIGSSYFTVTDSGRKGVLDEENELVVPIIFDELSQIKMAREGQRDLFYFIVTIDGKKGVLDEKNNISVPMIYDEIGFTGNSLIVVKNNQRGVINMKNEIIVPISSDNTALIPSVYDRIKYVGLNGEHFFLVTKGAEQVLINLRRQAIIPIHWLNWNNGLVVDKKAPSAAGLVHYALLKNNNGYGLISSEGEVIQDQMADKKAVINLVKQRLISQSDGSLMAV